VVELDDLLGIYNSWGIWGGKSEFELTEVGGYFFESSYVACWSGWCGIYGGREGWVSYGGSILVHFEHK